MLWNQQLFNMLRRNNNLELTRNLAHLVLILLITNVVTFFIQSPIVSVNSHVNEVIPAFSLNLACRLKNLTNCDGYYQLHYALDFSCSTFKSQLSLLCDTISFQMCILHSLFMAHSSFGQPAPQFQYTIFSSFKIQ